MSLVGDAKAVNRFSTVEVALAVGQPEQYNCLTKRHSDFGWFYRTQKDVCKFTIFIVSGNEIVYSQL